MTYSVIASSLHTRNEYNGHKTQLLLAVCAVCFPEFFVAGGNRRTPVVRGDEVCWQQCC